MINKEDIKTGDDFLAYLQQGQGQKVMLDGNVSGELLCYEPATETHGERVLLRTRTTLGKPMLRLVYLSKASRISEHIDDVK